jgi:chromosome segregation ATPase
VFKPALAQVIGSTGSGPTDLFIQFAVFALAVIVFAVIVGLVVYFLRRPRRTVSERREEVAPAPDGNNGTEIGSLMSAIRDQAVELRGKHAKVVSGLSLDFEVLTDRLATVGSRLNKALEAASKSEAAAAALAISNDEHRRKLADSDRELAFLRPLTAKMEDELRLARNQLTESERKIVAIETDRAEAQDSCNKLLQKMAASDLARQRTNEENIALVQRLNERDFAIQSLMRENAHLKSESATIAGNLELSEREARSVADKFATELESKSRANEALSSLQMQFSQFRKDAAAQFQQFEGRNGVLSEALAIKDKHISDSENKRLTMESKVDFMTRMNQRLREDQRRHLDHIGNLEAANRKLLDLLARHSIGDEPDADGTGAAPSRTAPKLIAPPEANSGG